MNELFRLLLSLSLSASLVIVLIFAADKLFKKRLDHTWHYYIWLIVIIRLLVPYAPELNLMTLIVQETGAVIQSPQIENTPVVLPQAETPMVNADTPSDQTSVKTIDIKEYLWIIWAVVAVAMFAWKVLGYLWFIRFSVRGRKRIENPDVLDIYRSAVRSLKLRRAPILYESRIAGLPMLIGVFSPYILIPDSQIDEQNLYHILLHELAHYKRRDGFYKWLVQIVVCIHWFNPFVYFMAKEIDKACELSCDEVVVRRLSRSERRRYGDMLLNSLQYSIQAPGRVMTLPLSKDGRLMKTRLNAIMDFKRIRMGGIVISLLLSVCIATGAAFAGVYPAQDENPNSVLREATGATYLQSRTIASWLGAKDIECASITDSSNPLIEGMGTYHKAFDLIGKDGNTYLLILRKEDNDFTAVLNSDGELLHGIVDSGVLPAFFENGEDKYSSRNNAINHYVELDASASSPSLIPETASTDDTSVSITSDYVLAEKTYNNHTEVSFTDKETVGTIAEYFQNLKESSIEISSRPEIGSYLFTVSISNDEGTTTYRFSAPQKDGTLYCKDLSTSEWSSMTGWIQVSEAGVYDYIKNLIENSAG